MVVSSTRQAITVDVGGYLITRVHADSLTIKRRSLWEYLAGISSLNKPWMLIGDFNAVLSMEEKKGGRSPLTSAMLDFNNCIQNCEMIQAPKTGLNFSWCNNRAGKKRIVCNLDRAFYNVKWSEVFPSWDYKVGTRGTSDHSPLFGATAAFPKPTNVPFRDLKVWLSHEGFKKVIEDAWKIENVFGDVRKKMKQADEEVLKLSLISYQNPRNINILNQLVTARGVQEIVTQQHQDIERQKSRVKWLKYGALNSRFFHVNMKIRQMQNAIVELENEEGELLSTQQGIFDILVKHIESKFKYKEVQIFEKIFDSVPKVILNEDNEKLESIPSAEEIKKAVFDLDPESSPGPDGFGGWFYKMAWDNISDDFVKAFQYCWEKEFIPSGMNANFIMLLPKVKNARKPNQFRPIGLMNFCFKEYSRSNSSRSEMINELDTKRRGGNVGLKLDISQAYDSLSWEFLFQALKRFGFSEKFVKWIHILLKSAKLSILVNGGPVGFFDVSRGLRQGDPLSPILFVIAEDVLRRNLSSMVRKGDLLPMVHRNGVRPTHIMFADDIFLFCNEDRRNLRKLLLLLEEYQKASGQEINFAKRKCFVGGTSITRKNQLTADCGMTLAGFPDKYLGVMLIPGLIRSNHVWVCVEMLQENLAGWKGKMLSFQERLVLVKLVLCSIPIFNMSVYKLPKKVLEESEKIIRNFLWSGNPAVRKTVTLKWEKPCSPLAEGGLGIKQLEVINKAMLMKLCWKIQNGKDEWAKFFQGIKWVITEVAEHTRWLVGDGSNISVWNDSWLAKHKSPAIKELWRVVALITMKEIWFLRNRIVYDEEKINIDSVKQRIIHFTKECEVRMSENMWNSSYDLQILKTFKLSCRKVKITRIIEIYFQLSAKPFILISCDGASRGNPGDAGYGFVRRKWDGEFIYAMSGGLGIGSNFLAEIVAILCAGEWAVNNNFYKVCFQTDSQAAIKVFQSQTVPWWSMTRWNKIKISLQDWYFSHNYREKNFSADSMANRGVSLAKGEKRSYTTIPEFMKTMEIPGKPYYIIC
ncbi:uncharacterized protein LOC113312800 [Papaver somniferum]|uniref:uncharacterized protein LOC113312800 n=1 Tax=Papaver somniferum TaxID=3469 RepID=UPI000E6FF073|nr:uncharacterized protein LOC113312800 [Papaver somniferum]